MSTLKVNTINAATSGQGVAVDLQNPKSFRNLIINGAMNVAQRGTSSTGHGMEVVDRWNHYREGCDENPTFAQADVASGTTPYQKGFRKSFKITNGNQSSGAGGDDYITIDHKIEAQDIANSGWDYTSTSSYITLSFWVKSSVAQIFYGYLKSQDGTAKSYPFSTGSLSADTWTKVTKTIPGVSGLQFDNNNEHGLQLRLLPFRGVNKTDPGVTLDAWGNWNNTARVPDISNTWWNTNDATFELTGVQLEVGDVATDFEHRSYGDELARCQRYYFRMNSDDGDASMFGLGWASATNYFQNFVRFTVEMRDTPSALTQTGTASNYRVNWSGGNSNCTTAPTFATATKYSSSFYVQATGLTTNMGGFLRSNDNSAYIAWSAEL